MIAVIELTDAETALATHILWDDSDLMRQSDEVKQAHCNSMADLMYSLIDRQVIPKIRAAYFDDPEMNPGGYGKSRYEVFVNNGNTQDSTFRHPHFLKYLKYFINGPDLPQSTIEGFAKIIEED